jgi:hypothetical protein
LSKFSAADALQLSELNTATRNRSKIMAKTEITTEQIERLRATRKFTSDLRKSEVAYAFEGYEDAAVPGYLYANRTGRYSYFLICEEDGTFNGEIVGSDRDLAEMEMRVARFAVGEGDEI